MVAFVGEAVEERQQLDRLQLTGDGGGPRVVDEVVALERRQCGQRVGSETGAQGVVVAHAEVAAARRR
jgi:hypothetical protein